MIFTCFNEIFVEISPNFEKKFEKFSEKDETPN
jgi:hypothetical protein